MRDEQERLIKAYLEDGIGRTPITDHVDQEKIMLTVQARRRNRTIVVGVGTLALVLGASGAFAAAAGGGHGRDPRPVTPAAATSHSGSAAPTALTRCGEQLPGEFAPNESPLTIAVSVGASARSGQDFHASAVITNISDAPVTAVGVTQPYISMADAGTVQMTQGPGRMAGAILQLQPGQSKTFELDLVAGNCSRKAAGMSPRDYARQHPLPAGDYQLYGAYSFQIGEQAVQTIASDPHDVSVT